MKLKVFGRVLEVLRERDQWALYTLGDGKKRKEDGIVIPAHFNEDEVMTFLADMLHEIATPGNSEVIRLD